MISRIIKVEVRVISRSRRLRLITLTETLIILDITKTESNNCFIIHWTNAKTWKSCFCFDLHWRQATRIAQHEFNPTCSYSEGLVKAGLPSLYDRRSQLCKELFNNIEKGDHKLSHLLPARPRRNYHLRSNRKFVVPDCKTNRYRDSFIISHCT